LALFTGERSTPAHATTFQQSIYPTVGAAIGLVLGFVLAFGLIYAWNLFRTPYRQRNDALQLVDGIQKQYDAILDSVRFKLAFDSLVLDTGKTAQGVSAVNIGIRLQNMSNELIQYRVTKFKVMLDNKTVDNPTFLTPGLHVYPRKTSDYFYPTIEGVDFSKTTSGTLEYEVEYSSIPSKYWYMSGRKFLIWLLESAVRLTFRTQEEKDSAIGAPSN
jgi:hypothetical protein